MNPQHKGALQYTGIAYFKTGRKPEAQAQQVKLLALCAGCEETRELVKAVAPAN